MYLIPSTLGVLCCAQCTPKPSSKLEHLKVLCYGNGIVRKGIICRSQIWLATCTGTLPKRHVEHQKVFRETVASIVADPHWAFTKPNQTLFFCLLAKKRHDKVNEKQCGNGLSDGPLQWNCISILRFSLRWTTKESIRCSVAWPWGKLMRGERSHPIASNGS